jgi:Cdc6-like AAA superfamily ATPase
MEFLVVRLGKDSISDIKRIDSFKDGLNTPFQLLFTCKQVEEAIQPGSFAFIYLGSDNSKGSATVWKQGVRALARLDSIDGREGFQSECELKLTIFSVFTNSYDQYDFLDNYAVYYKHFSKYPIIGVKSSRNNSTQRVIHGIRSNSSALLTALSKMHKSFLKEIQCYAPELVKELNFIPVGEIINDSSCDTLSATNTIFYGPPGTGKTYSTAEYVVNLLDSNFEPGDDKRKSVVQSYEKLLNNGQVIFTTFHQSYSYEDFVEGIRANTNKESKSISYDVEPGVFKNICESASDFEVSHKSKLQGGLAGREIWKMSLGNTYIGEEDSVYDYCIENEVVLLGYGDDVDFSNCKNSTQVYDEYKNSYEEVKPKDFAIQVVNTFVNKINKGDLVIISDGNHKFRAIAEITGDYHCLTQEQSETSYFQQARSVKWLLTYDQSRPKEELFKKNISQMTLYQLHDTTISREKLESLLKDDAPKIQDKQYAIVIDEINRGNISKIFGELITLIEPSKREGQPEALSVTLPNSKKPFSVPSNLHIIGTMNTADRSLALLDTALRRRFDFIEMMPDYDVLKNEAGDNYQVKGINLALMLKAMNDRIEYLYDREHTLGHAFLMPVVELIKNGDEGKAFEELKSVFMNKILPLLEEYFYEDWSKIALVLGDNQKDSTVLIEQRFVVEQAGINVSVLFGRNHVIDDYGIENKCYQLNTAMQGLTAAAFIAIYDVDKAKSLTDKLIISDVTSEETA